MPLDNQILATCEIVKIVTNRGHQQIPFPEFSDNLNGKNMDRLLGWPGYVSSSNIAGQISYSLWCEIVYKDEGLQRLDAGSHSKPWVALMQLPILLRSWGQWG